MKTVVFRSPWLDSADFNDAKIRLERDVPTQVTDEQAAILALNPQVEIVVAAAQVAPVDAPVETVAPTSPIASTPHAWEE